MTKKDATINDVLGAINTFSAHVDQRFERVEKDIVDLKKEVKEMKADIEEVKEDLAGVKEDLAGVKEDLAGVKEDLAGVKEDLAGVKEDLADVHGTMITKEYLDNALLEVRGDFVAQIRGRDRKVDTLIDILREKRVITVQETKKILASESFVKII
jgi:archaellum component FlaC